MDHSGPVRVDGLCIVGAFHGVGHAKPAAMEEVFLQQNLWYPEHRCPLHVRWQFILEHIPEMRTRHLYDNLSDLYREALKLPSCMRLFAFYDLTVLQWRFWNVLHERQLTLAHAFAYHLCAAQSWQRQLLERLQTQSPWRRNRAGRIKRPIVAPIDARRRNYNA